jgi:hypothetical protein
MLVNVHFSLSITLVLFKRRFLWLLVNVHFCLCIILVLSKPSFLWLLVNLCFYLCITLVLSKLIQHPYSIYSQNCETVRVQKPCIYQTLTAVYIGFIGVEINLQTVVACIDWDEIIIAA